MKKDYFGRYEIKQCKRDGDTKGKVRNMIVMDLKVDNLFAFRNFHINMSYPKKIVGSSIEQEHLEGRKNFRYKKVNIILGANASGKTSLGNAIQRICNFIDSKVPTFITDYIQDRQKKTSISMDFIVQKHVLYRVDIEIPGKKEDEPYRAWDINVCVRQEKINASDNYEKCVERLEKQELVYGENYFLELDKVESMSWSFQMNNKLDGYDIIVSEEYLGVLEKLLKVLDPFVEGVKKLTEVENAYVIRVNGKDEIMQEHNHVWKFLDNCTLSSGTRQGVEVAQAITGIIYGGYEFYYCDEKFSYIHSDIEKACLSIMIESLKPDNQLFFTTHNLDILDMDLPKHSFSFLKKDITDEEQPIKCVTASSFLKRNTDSLRNAVDNDLFNVAPEVDKIFEIIGMYNPTH